MEWNIQTKSTDGVPSTHFNQMQVQANVTTFSFLIVH